MTALRGIMKRVTCRKGIVGRGGSKQGTVRTAIPLAVRSVAARAHAAMSLPHANADR